MSGDIGGGSPRLRVAIVGLGPKGLFALERLLHYAHGPRAALEVDVFEPAACPGAGPVYDPGQPAYLRMNLASDRLSMWPAGSRAVPAAERLSFVDWRACDDAGSGSGRFPPRAQVGRYLAWGLAAMLRAAPPWVRVELHSSEILAACPEGSGWGLFAEGDPAGRRYDEVLLATGHRLAPGPSLSGTGARATAELGDATRIPAVFPVTRWLSRDRVPAGTTVAVRGFALTFIDAALALTEGRGGRFAADGGHPYRLRYEPTAEDAALILPFSRSGRPMLAKPEPGLLAAVPAVEAITQAGRDEILGLAPGIAVREELIAILASTAAASLQAARSGEEPLSAAPSRSREEPRSAPPSRSGEEPRLAPAPRSGEQPPDPVHAARRWLAAACDGRALPAGLTPAAELERSLAIGAGLHPPDLQCALGHAWRSLYPALVARLGGPAMAPSEWVPFRRLAAQMERLAFGPPAINAAKLLALIDAGRVDLSHVAGARMTTTAGRTSICGDDGGHEVDVVIDAVLPGPGVGTPLLERLVADGYARIAAGQRGLEVTADAACVARDGAASLGLSAIGRPTEDSVIGNDTLDRTLHPHADRWARRVSERASSRATAAPRAAA